jgi:hypothetical protein
MRVTQSAARLIQSIVQSTEQIDIVIAPSEELEPFKSIATKPVGVPFKTTYETDSYEKKFNYMRQ